jgi:hypothetical protein
MTTDRQPRFCDPVMLELDVVASDTFRLEELAYKVFTSMDALRGYLTRCYEDSAGGVNREEAIQAARG